MTKAAQIHLVKGLALAASPRIRVNSVSPGLMLTVCYTIRRLFPSPFPFPITLPSYLTLFLPPPPPLSIPSDDIHITARNIRIRQQSSSLHMRLVPRIQEWGLQFPQEKQQAARDRTPLKRLATVDDVADQVLCFARSRSVTGANAVIDGGLSI